MGNISFVILNYKAYQEAIACAESVLKTQEYEDIQIVIVDNGSGNGSAEKLREHFAARQRVHIVESPENLGFARGNNLGIRYAREHFSPDFIVAANSDILFEQPDFCRKLTEIYARRRYDILGGDVVDASRTQHFNPVAMERRYTLNYMRKQVLISWAKSAAFRLMKCLRLQKMSAGPSGDMEKEQGMGTRKTTREVSGKSVAADSRINEEMTGVLLHGCCLVFSKDFFREFDGFYDKTFLYAEEEILYYLAMKCGMTLLYNPEVICVHKEAVSTNYVLKDVCDAKIFYFSNITKSYRLFLKLMKQNREP